ncbi:MAG: hypothetical protein JSW25_08060 [Thermoplasmata archaeon]|nr:MAG: hypothetical protein JSW25_08060 [Thermoplasmata archaeon]
MIYQPPGPPGALTLIVSHKHRFIFIKTRKTAGTSIELYLSRFCGEDDIITPIIPVVPDADYHVPRNWRGLYNPFPDVRDAFRMLDGNTRPYGLWKMSRRFLKGMRFYNHIPAYRTMDRLPKEVWKDYYTFCFERNPWDMMISQYYWITRGTEVGFEEFMGSAMYQLNHRLYMDRAKEGVVVDRVARFEDLNEELADILGQLDIPFEGELGIKAKGKTRKHKDPYTEFFKGDMARYVDEIADICAREIDLLGYSYE